MPLPWPPRTAFQLSWTVHFSRHLRTTSAPRDHPAPSRDCQRSTGASQHYVVAYLFEAREHASLLLLLHNAGVWLLVVRTKAVHHVPTVVQVRRESRLTEADVAPPPVPRPAALVQRERAPIVQRLFLSPPRRHEQHRVRRQRRHFARHTVKPVLRLAYAARAGAETRRAGLRGSAYWQKKQRKTPDSCRFRTPTGRGSDQAGFDELLLDAEGAAIVVKVGEVGVSRGRFRLHPVSSANGEATTDVDKRAWRSSISRQLSRYLFVVVF